MARPGKGKASISAIVPQIAVHEIDARAKTLGMSRSRFTALIVCKWLTDGCPAVNQIDELVAKAIKEATARGEWDPNVPARPVKAHTPKRAAG